MTEQGIIVTGITLDGNNLEWDYVNESEDEYLARRVALLEAAGAGLNGWYYAKTTGTLGEDDYQLVLDENGLPIPDRLIEDNGTFTDIPARSISDYYDYGDGNYGEGPDERETYYSFAWKVRSDAFGSGGLDSRDKMPYIISYFGSFTYNETTYYITRVEWTQGGYSRTTGNVNRYVGTDHNTIGLWRNGGGIAGKIIAVSTPPNPTVNIPTTSSSSSSSSSIDSSNQEEGEN